MHLRLFIYILNIIHPTCTISLHTTRSSINGVFVLAGVKSSWEILVEKRLTAVLLAAWERAHSCSAECSDLQPSKAAQLLGISLSLASISSAH